MTLQLEIPHLNSCGMSQVKIQAHQNIMQEFSSGYVREIHLKQISFMFRFGSHPHDLSLYIYVQIFQNPSWLNPDSPPGSGSTWTPLAHCIGWGMSIRSTWNHRVFFAWSWAFWASLSSSAVYPKGTVVWGFLLGWKDWHPWSTSQQIRELEWLLQLLSTCLESSS